MKRKTLTAAFCLTLAALQPAAGVSATSLVGIAGEYDSAGEGTGVSEGDNTGAEDTAETEAAETEAKKKKKKKTQAPAEYYYSYLTGEPTEENQRDCRPMAVMIDNVSAATPQSGIGSAGVIYEIPAQYDINRLMAIFDDEAYKDVSRIGPVRSCRDYFIDFAVEFDAFYSHYGQVVYAYDLLNTDIVDNISGLQYQEAAGELTGYAGEDIYWRSDERSAPHNVYTNYEKLQTGVERNEYRTTLKSDYTGHFLFAEEGTRASLADGTATYIKPADYDNNPYFEYDESTGLYKRFQRDAEHIDDLTGEQLTFANVIIQYCPFEKFDENGYWDVITTEGGDAVIFTNGTYQNATWKKDEEWGQSRFYDADGNEIAINRGKTFVCIVQDTKRENLEIR